MTHLVKRAFGLTSDPQHDAERGEIRSIPATSETIPSNELSLHASVEEHQGFTFQPPNPALGTSMEVDADAHSPHPPPQLEAQTEGSTPNTFSFSLDSQEQTPAEKRLARTNSRIRRSTTPASPSSRLHRSKTPAGEPSATPSSQLRKSAEPFSDPTSKVRVVPSDAPLRHRYVKESIASVEASTSRAKLAEHGQQVATAKADEAAKAAAAALARIEEMLDEVHRANFRATKAEEAAQGALRRAEKAEEDALQALQRAESAENQAHLAMREVTAANERVVAAELELARAVARATKAEHEINVVLMRAREAEKKVELLEERLARAEDDEREVAKLIHAETDDKLEMAPVESEDTRMLDVETTGEKGTEVATLATSSPNMHTLAHAKEERVVGRNQTVQSSENNYIGPMSTSESRTSEREKVGLVGDEEMGSDEESLNDMYGSETSVRMIRLHNRSYRSTEDEETDSSGETPTPIPIHAKRQANAIEMDNAVPDRAGTQVDEPARIPLPLTGQQRPTTSARQHTTATAVNTQADSTSPEASRHRKVPPPQTFSRPRSGGNSNITFQMPVEVPMTREQTTRQRREKHVTRLFANNEDDEDDDSETEIDRNNQLYADGPKSKYFKQPRRKGYNKTGAAFKTAIRDLMNNLMGLEKNADIVNIQLADYDDLWEYTNGQGSGPSLEPMCPFLDGKNVMDDWNSALAELFVAEFATQHDLAPTGKQRVMIENAFLRRLDTLRKEFNRLVGKSDKEIKAMKDRANDTQRPSTRRNALWLERRDICLENSQGADGAAGREWRELLFMVDKLGVAGMSSDESDYEDGRPKYVVRWRKWRAREVQGCLEAIDTYANRSGGDGRRRPGNGPRQRIRSRAARASKRDSPIGCPENYYTPEFTANLSNRALRELDMKGHRALPRITRNTGD